MSTTASPNILLLPGMDGTGELLQDLRKVLSASHEVQVVAYPKSQPLDYNQLTNFVMEQAPNERFVVLGESFSGPIAIEVAIQRKELVAGLILASSFARHPLPSPLASIAKLLDLSWIPRSIIEAALLGSAGTSEDKTALARVLSHIPRDIMRVRMVEALRVDKLNRLGEVHCPTLCLAGRLDRLIRQKSMREIKAALPNCQICIFDAPHMLLQTHTSEAADVINQFCEQLL